MPVSSRKHLVRMYADGPAVLHAALNETPAESVIWKPDEHEWSIHEIIIHCADAEACAGVRIRQLAAEAAPVIVAWDQEDWARTLRYHDQPLEPALALVHSIRRSTTDFLNTVGDDIWSHIGHHTESGDYTADDWLATYGSHLHIHADQIRNNVVLWKESRTSKAL